MSERVDIFSQYKNKNQKFGKNSSLSEANQGVASLAYTDCLLMRLCFCCGC